MSKQESKEVRLQKRADFVKRLPLHAKAASIMVIEDPDLLDLMSIDSDWNVRLLIANSEHTAISSLERLANDSHDAVSEQAIAARERKAKKSAEEKT